MNEGKRIEEIINRARLPIFSSIALCFALLLSGCNRASKSSTDDSVNIPNPDITPPTIARPQVETPEVNVPQINTPKIDVPEIETPEVEVPDIEIPEIRLPEITIPDVRIRQNNEKTIYTLSADILFDFDRADIRPDAEAALQQISDSIAQRFSNSPLQINGHTDAKGSNTYNLKLSQKRAESVKQWLINNGSIGADRMTTQGLGESQPAAPNTHPDGSDNPQGRQINRRVEIIVYTT